MAISSRLRAAGRAAFHVGLVLVACLVVLPLVRPAQAIETQARVAILIDATTGVVLMEKDADQPTPPASMSKIMTVYMVFDRLKESRLSLDDQLLVSERAWRKGGSKMFVEVGDQVRVEDLLRGVIVQSGNDACIVLAEGLSGSEEAFAEEMNGKALEIALTGSTFRNSTGWPDPEHRMTARDLATLARRTINDFPDYYHYYGEREFTYNEIRQGNRNPLLYKTLGADGLKTGHTKEAGYGLTGSAARNGRRLILVVNGLESVRARSEESERLIQWGFREFNNYALFEGGETVDEAPVWLGTAARMPLVAKDDIVLTLTRDARKGMKVTVNYASPIPAPIREGQEVAKLVVTPSEGEPITIPLYAGTSADLLGPIGRLVASVQFLIFGSQ